MPVQTESYKPRLLEMRSRLMHEVSQVEEAVREDVNTAGDISVARLHMADSNEEDVDRNVNMAQNQSRILEQVEGALERIEAGTYGKCVRCEKEIAPERLEALPYTPFCRHCAEVVEKEGVAE